MKTLSVPPGLFQQQHYSALNTTNQPRRVWLELTFFSVFQGVLLDALQLRVDCVNVCAAEKKVMFSLARDGSDSSRALLILLQFALLCSH